jgi:hypothetical protein
MHYCARPGTLTETVKYVLELDDDFTITTTAAHGLSIGVVVSIQRSTSPFEYVIQNVVPIGIAASSIEFSFNLRDLGIGRGDLVTVTAANGALGTAIQESTAFIPQVPIELHDWLSYRTACRVLEHIGHMDLLNLKLSKVSDIEKDVLALISPRVDGSPKIIVGMELLGDFWR